MNTANSMNRDALAVSGTQIDLLRLKLLLKQSSTAILTNIVVSIITAVLLYSINQHSFAMVWIGLSLSISLARLSLVRFLKKKVAAVPESFDANYYENIYVLCTFFSGLLWGALGLAVNDNMPFMQQLSIPLMMLGMSAGAVFSHMSSIKTLRAFDIPLALPLIVVMSLNGFFLEATAVAVYLIAILILADQVYSNVKQSLALRFENSSLLAEQKLLNHQQTLLLQQLKEKEDFLTHSFEDAGVPMLLITPGYRILDVNKAASHLFECERDELLSSSVMELLHRDDSGDLNTKFKSISEGHKKQIQFTSHFISKTGSSLWLASILSAVHDEHGDLAYFVLQAQDITNEYALIEDLHYQTHHDALTGLPNRLAMEKYIRELLDKPSSHQHVFCYLDVDLLKIVNESSGHEVGDRLLNEFSKLLHELINEDDFLARFSGDEFAFVMKNSSLTDYIDALNQLLETIRKTTFELNNQHFKVTASIGVVVLGEDSNWVDVLKQADSACFAAKESGRDRIHLYSADDEHLSQRSGEIHWVSRIQQALEQDRLVLFSQKIEPINHSSNEGHCELLIRMIAEDGSIIAPGHFLPAAERYNLAASIDLWTVEHVLTRLQQAVEEGKQIQGVYAINLSGQSLGDSRFYESIIEKIRTFDLNGHGVQLCFEVTETAAITNIRAALTFIEELRRVGCQFALDDFGSGLSSFAYLKQLPIDYLKIDGMFVQDCLHNSVNMEIINSINGIGHVMGLKTIVEFIEDQQTLDAMAALGVDYAQGYYLGKPVAWQL